MPDTNIGMGMMEVNVMIECGKWMWERVNSAGKCGCHCGVPLCVADPSNYDLQAVSRT
jgi:hypothetical protein